MELNRFQVTLFFATNLTEIDLSRIAILQVKQHGDEKTDQYTKSAKMFLIVREGEREGERMKD